MQRSSRRSKLNADQGQNPSTFFWASTGFFTVAGGLASCESACRCPCWMGTRYGQGAGFDWCDISARALVRQEPCTQFGCSVSCPHVWMTVSVRRIDAVNLELELGGRLGFSSCPVEHCTCQICGTLSPTSSSSLACPLCSWSVPQLASLRRAKRTAPCKAHRAVGEKLWAAAGSEVIVFHIACYCHGLSWRDSPLRAPGICTTRDTG